MTVSTRVALGISAAALSLILVLAPAAFAQDAMQLDIDFKNSLSQRHYVQGPRYEIRDVQGRHKEGRRAEKGRRREKRAHVEASARR
jgi:hypothetical protein